MKNNPKIKISKALPGDEQGIFYVSKDTWLNTYVNKEYHITKVDILSKDFDSESKQKEWKKVLRSNGRKNKYILVAKDGGQIIGFCTAIKNEDWNEIGALYVLKSYQGGGIGTQLVSRCFEWLGNEKKVQLKVASFNNPAISFYNKCGFKLKKTIEFKKLPNGRDFPLSKMIKSR